MMRLDPEDESRCLNCGSPVSLQFRRVFGDSDDRAHRCLKCDSNGRLADGTAAGQESDRPDPLEDPTRFDCGVRDLPTNVRVLVEDQKAVATDGGEDGAE